MTCHFLIGRWHPSDARACVVLFETKRASNRLGSTSRPALFYVSRRISELVFLWLNKSLFYITCGLTTAPVRRHGPANTRRTAHARGHQSRSAAKNKSGTNREHMLEWVERSVATTTRAYWRLITANCTHVYATFTGVWNAFICRRRARIKHVPFDAATRVSWMSRAWKEQL